MIKILRLFIFIFTLIVLIKLTLNTNEGKDYANQNQNIIRRLNKSFNRIEYSLKQGNKDAACIEAIYASKFIGRKINKLKVIEPNYSWVEMSELLKAIPKQLCGN